MMNGTGQDFAKSSNRQRLGGSVNRDADGVEVLSMHSSASRSNFNGLADDPGGSIYSRQSKNYNPFYHPDNGSQGPPASMVRSKASVADLQAKQKEERRKLNEQRTQLMEEWGFQNEETAVAW